MMPLFAHGTREPRPVTGRTVLICITTFFAVVAGANAIMIKAAVSTFGGVETESSYKAGVAFSREVAAARAQDSRNWQVGAVMTAERGGQRIEVTARDPDGQPLTGLKATVQLSHPMNRSIDRSLVISEAKAGRYVGRIDAPPGQWDLIIELVRDDERVFRSKSRIISQ